MQISTYTGDWAEIEALAETTDLSVYEIDDKAYFESLTLLARCKLGHVDDSLASVADLLRKYTDQAIVPIVLYEVARHRRDRAWASKLFQTALDRRATLNQASRLMLAQIAESEGDAEAIIDLLYGQVHTDRDSEELRSLARAFVNSNARTTTVDFIQALPASLKTIPFYCRAIGSIRFNSGALNEAAESFAAAIAADPRDLVAHLGLINTWLRQDRKDLVEEHLRQINPGQLSGPPVQRMGLAQLLVAFGQPDAGLKLGYETALNNRGEWRVVQLYIGLFLPDATSVLIPPIGSKVEVDCWVRLTRDDHQTLCIVIEDGPDRPSIDHYGTDHSLAKAVLGHKKNDVIAVTPDIGTAQSWCIAEIKHKFLALLHDIIQTLPSRFPEAEGFYQFEIKEDDLTPITDQVKSLAEHGARILDNYLRNGFPLALASAILGKCSVEFAENVIQRGEVLRSCVGTSEERDDAFRSIRAAAGRGIVLDTYTAWVANSLGLIPVLKKMFKRVALAQSSLDELRHWRDRYQLSTKGEALMTIGYVDGQYVREEISAERLAESVATINAGICALQAELEILPAVAPSAPSEMESALLQIAVRSFFDPIYISKAENLLLLSDDFHYRNIACNVHKRDSVWLQPALLIAADTGKMTGDAYARAVVDLAIRKYDHITLNARTLIEIAKADDTEGMQRFKVAIEFIGTPTADLKSHFAVSWEFLKEIWRTSLPYLRRAAAAGAILERLTRLLSRYDQLNPTYLKMIENSTRQPLLRDYLIGWARGHFLNIN